MLRIGLTTDPRWIDLGDGVRVRVAPPVGAVRMAVLMELQRELRNVPDDDPDRDIRFAVAEAKAYARRVITDWEGVADGDGKPIEKPTPELAAALMDYPTQFMRFSEAYLAPLRLLEQEKNASAPSPSGSSAGAQTTARRARKTAKNVRAE